jgi:hypothetical protein
MYDINILSDNTNTTIPQEIDTMLRIIVINTFLLEFFIHTLNRLYLNNILAITIVQNKYK